MRAEHLRKPLIDLRLNLAALHDGMVSFDIANVIEVLIFATFTN